MTSRAAHLILAAAVGIGMLACDKSGSSSASKAEKSDRPSDRDDGGPAGPAIVRPEGSEPASGDVIARGDEIEVTFADYERFLRRTRLFAPREGDGVAQLSRRRKANPRLQSQTVRSLLEHRVVERAADERRLEVSAAEVEEFVRNHEKLSRWVERPASDVSEGPGLPAGLTSADVRTVARSRLRRRKLRNELVDAPSPEKLWELYERRHTKVRIAYVAIANAPTPEEIDAFVAEHGGAESSRIREYFETHREKFRRPKLVEVTVVRPAPGEDVDRETLSEAAGELGDGASAEQVAGALELEFEERSYLRRKENPEAFEAESGATGFQMEGPRGAYAWRVEGWRAGGSGELDRGLRREIAAEMLRREVVPSVRDRLESVLDAMRQASHEASWPIASSRLETVRSELSGGDASLEITEPFARDRQETVPGLGIATPVTNVAFGLSREDPVAEEPVLNRERAVALMLLERDGASRAEFEKRRESFRNEVLERRRKQAVDQYLEQWFSRHEPSIDLGPIRAKYGRLEK